MIDQIKEVIEKNLPSTTANVLKQYLAEAEEMKLELAHLRKADEQLREKNRLIEKDNQDLRRQLELAGNVKEQKEQVEKRTREMEVEMLKVKLEESNKRAEVVTGLVDTVFRNRVLTIEKTRNYPTHTEYGTTYDSETETITKGET